MGLATKGFIIVLGLIFVGVIILLLVKRKINERHSLFWLFGAIIILILSTIPEILAVIANLVGVDYPPALLFLIAILVILAITLYQSIQISILQERLRELTQQIAIDRMNNSVIQRQKEEDYVEQ
ncbi:MAG: hypothetical protein CVU87_08545 [Firmicutes bacterium HGW-Firmicutes-12]|jgi:hypothetical protein|nr:MAG: hypothetical protein CVU87_08545 [Firmicutes bacterium HGW-Firmicutes-12]